MRKVGTREAIFWLWIVKRLPKRVVYFCFLHVMSYATSGKYSGTIVPELSGMDAIDRYGKDHNI